MCKNPYEIELADVAEETGGDLVINYYNTEMKLPLELLRMMKEVGCPTDVMSCVVAGLTSSGRTDQEIEAFLNEAEQADGHLSVSFVGRDGNGLNIKSKEENPLVDQLVQIAEEDDK